MRGVRAASVAVVCCALWASAGPAAAVVPPTASPSDLTLRVPSGPPQATEQKALCGKPFASSSADVRDPSAAQQLMQVQAAWRYSKGEGIKVAVIDTGVQPSKRFTKVIGGGDFVSNGNGLTDCDGHGTMVAGIIAGKPSTSDGFAGVAPAAEVIAIRQTSLSYGPKDNKSGGSAADIAASSYGNVQTLAYAVVAAVQKGADVINISEVACGPAGTPMHDGALGAALQYAYRRNVVVVAAAGNLVDPCKTQNTGVNPANPAAKGWDTLNTVVSPGWYSPYLLTVGGVDSATGSPWPLSLHGPWVSVAAPATGLVSVGLRGQAVNRQEGEKGPVTVDGTSFASPYVAGLAALIKARFKGISAADVMRRITATAHGAGSGRNDVVGYGVVDPVAALSDTVVDSSVDAAASRPIAPPDATGPDHTARNVALAGTGVCLLTALVWWAISIPRRRLRKLGEDDY
ncbi:type VII secretion-associated serine protease mycosin [Gordonia sp. SID5947]|uniref:type VII secretion-associated serine protease mycosin n=1 Tax=Gordonia sp. SID5947 TaxID=2690315 RepID=UPI00136EC616|nr:type VII secretion-associated serine protease mycosin [Gordonia sp. SID5947]MYR07532.1 type VII secretion-associated serine protease mycosin [Gordonia sp. SID5947]